MKKSVLFYSFLLLAFVSNAQWLTQSTNFPAASTGIKDISIVSENVVWASGYNGTSPTTPFAGFCRTLDGGTTWTSGVINNVPANYTFSNIMGVDGFTAYACMFDGAANKGGGIFKTVDGGFNWTQQGTGLIFDDLSFPNFVHFWNSNRGICQGDPNAGYYEIYTTTDGGTNWTRVPKANIPDPLTDEVAYVEVYEVIGDTIWFGTNKGRVFKSVDAGLNWDAYYTGVPSVNGRIAFKNTMEGLLTYVNNNAILMVKTVNGGQTWTNVFPSGTMFINDLKVIRETGIYVSSGVGVSFSNDDGAKWSTLDSGTQRMQQRWLDANTGWIGGFTNSSNQGGIFKYQASWPMNVNNTNAIEQKINVFPNPANGKLNLEINGYNGAIEIAISDALGRTIISRNQIISNSIDISSLKEGIYFLNANIEGKTFTKKIVIQ